MTGSGGDGRESGARGVRTAAAALLLFLATLAVYQPATRSGFIWDDHDNVVANPLLQGEDQLERIWTLFLRAGEGRGAGGYQYYPLTFSSYWLQRELLGGLDARTCHWINVVLHAVCAVLVGLVARVLGLSGAWLGAACFALHPVCVESVAWITERKNVLSGVFYLLAALAFLHSDQRGRRWGTWLALLCFALALLSKTHAVILPPALVLALAWRRRRWTPRRIAGLAPFFALAAAAGGLTVLFESGHVEEGAGEWEWGVSGVAHLALAGRIVWFYGLKLLWPHPLVFIYPRWELDASQPEAWLPLASLVLGVALLWWRRDGWGRDALFALAYYVVALLPVLGFVRLYFMRYSYVQDHFQYFAAMGMVPFLVAGACRGWRATAWGRRRGGRVLATASASAVLALLAGATWRQQGDYRDLESLWIRTLEKNPTADIAHANLGVLKLSRGDVEGAIGSFRSSLAIRELSETHVNLGTALRRRGRLEEALRHYRRAVELNGSNADARFNLANACFVAGDVGCAVAEFRRTLEIDPAYAPARRNLDDALALTAERARGALAADPDSVEAYRLLAWSLLESGADRAAAAELARFAPADVDTAARVALAWAASPDPQRRDGAAAVALAEPLSALAPDDPGVLDVLAAAYAEAGRFPEAVATAGRALALAEAQGRTPLVDSIRSRLEIYRSGRALPTSAGPAG